MELYEILQGFSLMVLYMVLIVFAKAVNDFLTPYHLDDELTNKDNVALSVSICGYFLAVSIIFIGALSGPSQGVIADLISVGGYSMVGIGLLNLARVINDRLILYKFSNFSEIIEDRNAGTGAVQMGSYLASGMIIAGAVNGEGGGVHTVLTFYGLGQIALIVFTYLYNLITPFDIHDEIEKDNVAAGVGFGGSLIAVGILLMRAVSGDFISWKYNLSVFGTNIFLVFILIPVVRYFFDKVIIPGEALNREIQNDRNLGAAFLEASMAISFAVILYFTLG